jgi:hypothetical protein
MSAIRPKAAVLQDLAQAEAVLWQQVPDAVERFRSLNQLCL